MPQYAPGSTIVTELASEDDPRTKNEQIYANCLLVPYNFPFTDDSDENWVNESIDMRQQSTR